MERESAEVWITQKEEKKEENFTEEMKRSHMAHINTWKLNIHLLSCDW